MKWFVDNKYFCVIPNDVKRDEANDTNCIVMSKDCDFAKKIMSNEKHEQIGNISFLFKMDGYEIYEGNSLILVRREKDAYTKYAIGLPKRVIKETFNKMNEK